MIGEQQMSVCEQERAGTEYRESLEVKRLAEEASARAVIRAAQKVEGTVMVTEVSTEQAGSASKVIEVAEEMESGHVTHSNMPMVPPIAAQNVDAEKAYANMLV